MSCAELRPNIPMAQPKTETSKMKEGPWSELEMIQDLEN